MLSKSHVFLNVFSGQRAWTFSQGDWGSINVSDARRSLASVEAWSRDHHVPLAHPEGSGWQSLALAPRRKVPPNVAAWRFPQSDSPGHCTPSRQFSPANFADNQDRHAVYCALLGRHNTAATNVRAGVATGGIERLIKDLIDSKEYAAVRRTGCAAPQPQSMGIVRLPASQLKEGPPGHRCLMRWPGRGFLHISPRNSDRSAMKKHQSEQL